MLTGKLASINGNYNIDCYPTLPGGAVPTIGEGGVQIGLSWLTPMSKNGLRVTGYKRTIGSASKPTTDSFKVLTVQDKMGGYKEILVQDAWTATDYESGTAITSNLTPPDPDLTTIFKTAATQVCVPDISTSIISVPAFTGTNNRYTITGKLVAPNGNTITLSPTTVTAASVAALATAMQTSWATVTGGGTFTASGSNIIAATPAGTFTGTIAQSQV